MKANRYAVDRETGCWIWQLHTTKCGYGWVRSGNKSVHAHRVEWEKVNGPIPRGYELDHLCRRRNCVNPEHLEPVTSAENTRRGSAAKLTIADIKAIRDAYARGGTRQSELAAKYGVHSAVISKIVNGKTWVADIENPVLTKRQKSSRFTGVSFHRAAQRWRAYIIRERKTLHLGLFDTEEEAASAVSKVNSQIERNEYVNNIGGSSGIGLEKPTDYARCD